jgi:gluconokinase
VRVLVLMGVSGAGKSFLGQWLSQATGLDLIEGDNFHSPASREK